ncbi:MAG: hypothetical protein K6G80_05315 [Treponema sp.]|nr:hypothetical protein [Treponema sp.]
MKKTFLFSLTAGLLVLALAACSNLGDISEKSSNNVIRFGSDQTLTLSLNDDSLKIARTLYPGDWSDWDQDYADDDLASTVHYVLTGYTVDDTLTTTKSADSSEFKNSSDKTMSYEEFTYAKLMKSEASVSIKPLIWYFTLTAYQTAITDDGSGKVQNTDVCLVGTAWADMTGGAKTITFKMAPPAASVETTAYGYAKIGLTFTPPNDFAKMTYGFYKESTTTAGTPDFSQPATDAVESGNPSTVVTLTKVAKESPTTAGVDDFTLNKGYVATGASATPGTVVATSAKSKNGVIGCDYTYVLKDEDGNPTVISNALTAGNYWFKAEFYDDKEKRICVYIEKVVIDGSNTTMTDELELLEQAFNSAPQSIQDLTLTYKFNNISFNAEPGTSAHQLSADGTDKQTTYSATLKWTDVADNETGYEVWLKYFAASDTDLSTATPTSVVLRSDTAAATLSTYGLTAANLLAGLTECTLTLNTGTRYQISVRAYNDFSKEQASYDDAYDATAAAKGYDRFVPYTPRNDTDPDADNLTFGLYTIDYNLNGGRIKQTSAKTTAAAILHYIVPYVYKEANMLIGETELPYIKRSGYTFVGWNELYGTTKDSIYNAAGSAYSATKVYYTNPALTVKAGDGVVFTSTGTNQGKVISGAGGATIVLDSIVVDDPNADSPSKVASPLGDDGYLATYSWTIPVYYKKADGKFYSEAECTTEVDVPDYSVVSPAREELSSDEAAAVTKCAYSNVLLGGGLLTDTDFANREVFASWETPLAFNITLPKYSDFKLTKQAAAGDPLVYSVGETVIVEASSKLSDVEYVVYKDDGTSSATDLFAADSALIQTTGITVSDGKLTWVTKVASDPAEATDYAYTAMTYYVKVTGTYTYDADPDNSLSGTTDTIEGYIFIRLTN